MTVFAEAFERGATGEAVVDSITDEWVFFGGIGAGAGASLVFATVTEDFPEATATFAFAGTGTATFAFSPDFPVFEVAEDLAEAKGDFTANFLAATFLAAGAFATAFFATVFFTTAFFATGFLSTGLDLAFEAPAFATAFSFGFVAGLARVAALPDLAAD